MNRFKNILVVVDDPTTSHTALARGVQMARRNGARLTVVHAYEGPRRGILAALEGISARELEEFEREARLMELEELVSGARTRGVDVTVKLLVGTPFIEIVREVLRAGHDLVLKDAPRRGEIGGQLFTSLDMHLMRKCPCPLWMVRFSNNKRYRRVVAAVDPETPDTEHSSLNQKVLDLATAVARLDGSELHVVHAWHFYGESSLRSPRYGLSPTRVEAVVEGYRARVSGMLDELVRNHCSPDLMPQVHLVKGEPARTLLFMMRKIRADLLVMGTVGRTGVTGFFIGNTAETVLNEVNCSVLAIKPDGFLSPVQLPVEAIQPEEITSMVAGFGEGGRYPFVSVGRLP